MPQQHKQAASSIARRLNSLVIESAQSERDEEDSAWQGCLGSRRLLRGGGRTAGWRVYVSIQGVRRAGAGGRSAGETGSASAPADGQTDHNSKPGLQARYEPNST